MYEDGVIKFPEVTLDTPLVKRDGFYHTAFGPCVAHNGDVYAANNHNMAQAFKARLAKCRLPEILGYEELMQQNQQDFIRGSGGFVEQLRSLYEFSCDDYTNMIEEAMDHHADPHMKRDERIAAFLDCLDENIFNKDCWFMDKRGIVYQFKKAEIAKPEKAGRVVGNLGCAASLQGFRLTQYMKYAMAENVVETGGGKALFVPKPGAEALESCMSQLIEPEGRFFFAYHSDDSCLAIRKSNGEILRANIDISSCDASHTQELFEALYAITPDRGKKDMRCLIKQCQASFEIRDLFDKRNKIKLKPETR